MIKEKREKKKANNNLTNNSVATSSSNNTNDNMTPSADDEQVAIKTEQDDETKKIKEEPGEDKCHSPHNEKPSDLPDIKTEDLLNDPGNPGDGNSDMLDSKNDLLLPDGKGMNSESIQPLPSNVINKQPGTMEAQYMQQQSQIFVFSTQLANKAAEGVLGGQYPSIISYHCSQPKTKKYLEKHPLKINQFNRQNSNQWLNSLVHMKKGPMKGQMGPRDSFKSNMMGMGPSHMMGPNNMGMGGMCGPGGMMQGMGPGPGGMMGPGPRGMGPGHGGMGPSGPMHSGSMHGGPMHSGPGGPMHTGPGGPMHSGPGGPMHSGPGGPMHSGPGGQMHSGPGGPMHSGPGGQMHSGQGGQMHSGPGGQMHSGPGGPMHSGPGGPMHSGPGGQMHSGPGGPMHSGPGGQMHSGPGGQMHSGPGGQMHSGPGGQMHSGPGGQMHSGPGGPMHSGPGGQMHSGPGGQMHSGPGGPMHSGPGGPMHSGPGGQMHSGPGGPMHSGPGGPMHSGPGGPMHSGPGGPMHRPSGPGEMGPGNSGPGCLPPGMNSGPEGMNSGPGNMNPCMGNPRMPWNQGNMPMDSFMMDSCQNNMGPGGPMKPGGPQGHMIGGPGQFMMNRPPNPNNPPNNSNNNNNSSNMIPSLDDFNDDALEFNQHASISRVKVPDEDLTPQQRQHREEQLATLRKMHELLFSRENQPNMPQNPNGGPNQNMGDPSASQGQMSGGPPTSTSGGASRMDDMLNSLGDSDWQKMQIPFFDERNKKESPVAPENGGSNSKGRGGAKNQKSQGPPPPYHQATRSASVPVAVPSPGPGSPNNPTSNLSLPSPRTCSALGLNSPDSRQSPSATHNLDSPLPSRSHNPSNNGSPVSNKTHPSPSTKKDLSSALSNEFSPAGHSDPEDSMFSRSLQVLAQDQKNSKEPDLMSVPSPQHIQNFNTFEGQELTIQKQPNTSLKESSSTTPPSQSVPNLDNNPQEISGKNSPSNPLTPTSSANEFPPISSADSKMPPQSQSRFSPQQMSDARFPQNNFHSGSKTGPGMGSPFMNISPPPTSKPCGMICDPKDSNFFRVGPDNIPLNPDVNMERKPVHFDPISSLAQMSQQLTSAVSGSPMGQPGNMMGPGGPHGRMGFNGPGGPGPMHMMQMNDLGMCGPGGMMMGDNIRMFSPDMGPGRSMSPKMGSYCGPGGPGMRPGGPVSSANMYSGANVQVKANAPNTISYLPTRPQGPDPGPRGQPNLDFLQRFPNPLSNLDSKVPTHKYQYFPNSFPPQNNMGGGMCDMMNCNTPPGMMGPRGPNIRPNGPNMMYPGPGPKGPPGLAPDASQPLPPSMGQTNLKSSNYIGPTTADPNYAQQFHNFQQQLYATSSRNQMPGPGGPGLPPPQTMPSQHQFFMPK